MKKSALVQVTETLVRLAPPSGRVPRAKQSEYEQYLEEELAALAMKHDELKKRVEEDSLSLSQIGRSMRRIERNLARMAHGRKGTT